VRWFNRLNLEMTQGVDAARAAAWSRAKVLWTLRELPPLRHGYEEMNERAVGFAGRALLVPLGLVV
jgi:hypothetical protein